MIRSMTGFGAAVAENEDFKIQVEIKTVNHRFLETGFRMPHSLVPFEGCLLKLIKKYLARGKAEISIKLQDLRKKNTVIHVNADLAQAYGQALEDIRTQLKLRTEIKASEIASYPEVLIAEEEEMDMGDGEALLLQAMEKALQNLVSMREQEGANIYEDLILRARRLMEMTAEAEKLAPEIVEGYRQRLFKALEEYVSKDLIDESRLVQEVAFFTDKVNYTEETVRLRSHFAQFQQILDSEGAIGRKLDFLIQEINREINTIASKANSTQGAVLVVEMKSEVEKIREQIQNIE